MAYPPSPGQPYPPPMPPPQPANNGYAITGMVLGIVSLPALCVPVVNFVMGPLAIVFSVLGMRRSAVVGRGKGMAISGLVLGIISTVLILLVIAGVATIDSNFEDWEYSSLP